MPLFPSYPGPADGATVTSLRLRAVPNSSLIRPIPAGTVQLGELIDECTRRLENQRLFHWCRMPCTEMKDLEAIHSRYGERKRTAGEVRYGLQIEGSPMSGEIQLNLEVERCRIDRHRSRRSRQDALGGAFHGIHSHAMGETRRPPLHRATARA